MYKYFIVFIPSYNCCYATVLCSTSILTFPMYPPDFISLELIDGHPVLMVNYGSGTTRINNTVIRVSDGQPHLIEIVLSKTTIELFVDDCHYTSCMALSAPTGLNEQLNGKYYLIVSSSINTGFSFLNHAILS